MQRRSLGYLFCAVAVASCLAAPVIAQDQHVPTIAELRVEGLRTIPKQAVLDVVKDLLVVGRPFEAADAKASEDALMATGRFTRAKVATAELTAQGAVIGIWVVEKVKIRRIFFVGNSLVPTSQLEQAIKTKVGDVPDDAVLRQDVRRVEDCFMRAGGIAHVSGLLNDGSGGTYVFVINEARIEGIEFVGLQRTASEVVQKELALKAGELFSENLVARDLQKLFNLGLFKNVTSDIKPGKEDPFGAIVVVITFTEKPAN